MPLGRESSRPPPVDHEQGCLGSSLGDSLYEVSGWPCPVGQLVHCSKLLFKRVQGLKSNLLITSQFTWEKDSFCKSPCRLPRGGYIFLIHAKVLCRLLAVQELSMKARPQGLP